MQGIHTQVFEGRAADQICIWAQAHQVDLMVLCSHGEGNATKWDLGNTARRIVERARGSVLLVPAHVEESPIVRYRRLLVPLDGSSRAESAILIAVRLAEAQKAELLLVHVVPEPELTEIGPLEPEDIELRKRLVRRNQRVAQEYLDRIRARLVDKGVPIRTLILQGGDVRHTLARAIVDEAADLAVVASHGRSGHIDTAAGNVTAYLIGHTPIPLLVVRSYTTASMGHAGAGRNYARFRLSSQTLS